MPTPSETRLHIGGMHCASCVSRIESALQGLPGVSDASVNLAAESAVIRGSVDMNAAIQAVEKLGYTAKPAGQNPADNAKQKPDKSALRMWGAVVLAIPVVIIGMGHLHFAASDLIQAIAGTIVVFVCGWPFFVNTITTIRRLSPDMDTLIAMGTFSAWAYSVWLMATGNTEHGLYFESAAVIVTFVLIGRHLEARAREKTGDAIRALLSQQPDVAHRLNENGQTEDIKAEEIQINDRLLVKPGETIPADGDVLDGESSVNESMLTGESKPVKKSTGSKVTAGTVNTNNPLTIKATGVGENTVFSGIIRLVENARDSKPQAQRLADKIGGVLVPIVLVLALMTFSMWFVIKGDFNIALINAVCVLVIACPCALGLATPVAIQAAIGKGARQGILVRNAEALEKTSKIDCMVLDKTGTITLGQPKVVHFYKTSQYEDSELLAALAAIESRSEHPIAQAIIDFANEKNVERNPQADNINVESGQGIRGTVDGKEILIGHENFLKDNDVDLSRLADEAGQLKNEQNTLVWFSVNNNLAGLIGISDALRPDTKDVIKTLRSQQIEVIMLTGDTPEVARRIAKEAGIATVQAGASPKDKQNEIEKLQQQGRTVAMAGDGINDAAALAKADISIAMGTGTSVAMETADITLAGGKLANIPRAIELSRQTRRVIRQNLFWAFAYNLLALPLAALGFLSPMIAGGAMALSSITVVLNALRLSRS